ncbi:MFS transporter [Sphingobium sufflavum]|uniref:MFS transporter n=1 Tax=Sphingobium sufflavum TaxID=1129547 RepID=UPI001F37E480|nr:MFS transporter [Sphingobium sufflavum]MCE7796125.1 MFS transporter [Sphingobium sufflavum]
MTSPATAALPPVDHPYAAFAFRDYRMFFLARITNNFGTNIMMPALGWQIYTLTRDPLALGLIGMAVFIPVVLSTLPAGQAADRLERRRVYQMSQLVLVLSALSFVGLSLGHATTPLYFYLAAAVFGAGKTFSMPTAMAWMPHLLPRAHFPNGVAWTSSAFQISNVVGPAIVGFTLYAFGEAPTYALAAACYFASFLFAALVRTRSRGADNRQASIAHLFSGLSYIWRNRLIFGATTLDLFALLLGGATAMLPVYAHEVLHVGEGGFGILRSAPAIGAAATGLLLAHRPLRDKVGTWLFASVTLYGGTVILFGISRIFILSVLVLILLGAAEMIGGFIRQTLVQLSTHDDMRGRVTSINMMFGSARNELGDVQSGFVASLIGVVPAVVLGGACTLVVAGLWAWLFPALRNANRFDDAFADLPQKADGSPPAPIQPTRLTTAVVIEELLEEKA